MVTKKTDNQQLKITITEGFRHENTNEAYIRVRASKGKWTGTLFSKKSQLDAPSMICRDMRDKQNMPAACRKDEFNSSFKDAIKRTKRTSNVIVTSTGWHGKQFYVTPTTTIRPEGHKVDYLYVNSNGVRGKFQKCSASNYKPFGNALRDICLKSDMGVVAISAAFAGALLAHSGNTGGLVVHLCNSSTTGKSTLLRIVASLSSKDMGFITRNSDFTEAGLEDTLGRNSDQTLLFDELFELTRSLGPASFLHLIADGQGRTKSANSTVQAEHPNQSWNMVALGASESSIAQALGPTTKDGARARLIEISNDEAVDLKEEFENAESAAKSHKGFAFRKFLKELISLLERKPHNIRNRITKFENKTIAESNYEKRKIFGYALLATSGELMIKFGLLDLKKGFFVKKLKAMANCEIHSFRKKHETTSDVDIQRFSDAVLANCNDRASIPTKKQLSNLDFNRSDIKGFSKQFKSDWLVNLKPEVFERLVVKCCAGLKTSKDVKDQLSEFEILQTSKTRSTCYKQVQISDKHDEKQVSLAVLSLEKLQSHRTKL